MRVHYINQTVNADTDTVDTYRKKTEQARC